MKQLLQYASDGLIVEEVPAPRRRSGEVLVRTSCSVISAGTERASLEQSQTSLIGKARARPDLVRKVLTSAREEGIATTYDKVRGRLERPGELGYSLAGIVLEAGDDAPAGPGELVACAGAGYASHAEIVSVPRRLCAKVPDGVAAEDAAYSTVGSIALHGVRIAEVGLGDVAAVIGLGLVGQLTAEILKAAGCVVLGVDLDEGRVELARQLGIFATTDATELEAEAKRLTDGRGADGVLITAASRGPGPLATATGVARERAIVCVVGDVALQTPRAPMFKKELKLIVSRSYGPGRYDPRYEESGIDYPAGYVRWTEGRNLEEVLRLMAAGSLRPSRLTSHSFDFDDAAKAYEVLGGEDPSLGIVLRYEGDADPGHRRVSVKGSPRRAGRRAGQRPQLGVIGAGGFATSVLLPELVKGADIATVVTSTGASATAAAKRFDAELASTEPEAVFENPDIDGIVVATRHDSHAEYVVRGLEAGKHVFVEKPLALDEDQLRAVELAADASAGILVVGFNRRFAPLAVKMRAALGDRGPLMVTYRVNAGRVPRSHWQHDPQVGGGRIVGEGCHFVDFAGWMVGSTPTEVHASAVSGGSEPRDDNVAATLRYEDGSVAVIIYSALGDKELPKERVEVLGEAGAGVLDDYRALSLHTGGTTNEVKPGKQDKGHSAELAAFLEGCRTGRQPWPIEDMLGVMRATFEIRARVDAAPSPGPGRP
jgi:predicted dehydrogenase/threonine dehydrogenase-like Zn-dependent dehydrogenase